MDVSLPLLILIFRCAFITIARKGQHDKASTGMPGLKRKAVIAIVLAANWREAESFAMTQTTNRFFDEIGRLMNDAAGAAQGVKREFDTVMRAQAERIL